MYKYEFAFVQSHKVLKGHFISCKRLVLPYLLKHFNIICKLSRGIKYEKELNSIIQYILKGRNSFPFSSKNFVILLKQTSSVMLTKEFLLFTFVLCCLTKYCWLTSCKLQRLHPLCFLRELLNKYSENAGTV